MIGFRVCNENIFSKFFLSHVLASVIALVLLVTLIVLTTTQLPKPPLRIAATGPESGVSESTAGWRTVLSQ